MAIGQPLTSNKLSSPDHSLSHRVFANDDAAVAKAVVVDSANNIILGDGGVTSYTQISASGRMTFSGSAGISWPYGSFSSTQTQTIASTTASYVITYNTDDYKSQVTHSTSVCPGAIYVDVPGTYLITFSAIGKSAAPNKKMDIWLSVNGSNVANSNTISRFVGAANERVVTVTYINKFLADQYFELYWCSDDTGTVLLATSASTNPTRPVCPSIITTVNMISKD